MLFKPVSQNHEDKHQRHFDTHRTWVQIRPRSLNHLSEYLVYSAIAPHNIHGGFAVFVSLLIEACQTFPPLCVNMCVCCVCECKRGCVCVCVCACSDLSADMSITCEFTSSKFQTLVSDHEPKQGDGFLFCSRPFWKERLPPSHHPPSTYNPPQTHTHTHTLQFHKKRMESLEWKAFKVSISE